MAALEIRWSPVWSLCDRADAAATWRSPIAGPQLWRTRWTAGLHSQNARASLENGLVFWFYDSGFLSYPSKPIYSYWFHIPVSLRKKSQRRTINVLSLTAVDPIYFISEVPRLILSIWRLQSLRQAIPMTFLEHILGWMVLYFLFLFYFV